MFNKDLQVHAIKQDFFLLDSLSPELRSCKRTTYILFYSLVMRHSNIHIGEKYEWHKRTSSLYIVKYCSCSTPSQKGNTEYVELKKKKVQNHSIVSAVSEANIEVLMGIWQRRIFTPAQIFTHSHMLNYASLPCLLQGYYSTYSRIN